MALADSWCDLLMLISTIVGTVVVCLGYRFGKGQWLHSKKEKRAEFLDSLQQRFEDRDMLDFFYKKIDDETNKEEFFVPQKKGFLDEKDEIAADKLLRLLSFICYLKRSELLTDDEFEDFRYVVDRTLSSPGISAYLDYFYGSHVLANGNMPFDSLLKYGAENGYPAIAGIWKRFEDGVGRENAPTPERGKGRDFGAYLTAKFQNLGTLSSMRARTRRIEESFGQSIEVLVSNDETTRQTLDALMERLGVALISIPNYRAVIKCAYRYFHGHDFKD